MQNDNFDQVQFDQVIVCRIESGCFSGIISLSVGDKKESSSLMKINNKKQITNNSLKEFKLAQSVAV